MTDFEVHKVGTSDEIERLRAMTAASMGVGDGNGQLFVHGDYASIKAAQEIVFRMERAEAERDALRKELDRLAAAPQQQAEPPQMPIMRVTVDNGVAVHGTFYAPGLPDGEHDLFCAPCSPDGQWAPSMFADPRITAEQVAELKRLADEYAEWSAAHAETFDSEYEGPYSRKESLAAEKAARAALHAALDALVKETP